MIRQVLNNAYRRVRNIFGHVPLPPGGQRQLKRLGNGDYYQVDGWTVFAPDFSSEEIEDLNAVLPYTMTTPERIVALLRSIRYIVANDIQGDIVECGVWRGGSMMAAARLLRRLGVEDRHFWLYDTFEGMPTPNQQEAIYNGKSAQDMLEADPSYRCFASIDEVRANLSTCDIDPRRLHFVKGKVEDTIPGQVPERIALLRLDTDWYESTMHELTHLFPRLSPKGVIIIDDFGHWKGAQKATEEYFQRTKTPLLLNRIDYSARIGVKA